MVSVTCFNQAYDVESKAYGFFVFLVGSAEYSDSDGQFMLRFDLGMIVMATDDFSSENTLGQGGFGTVYKGTFPNGQEVAVKRLTKGSGQGDMEFKNEVSLLTRLQHKNLVKLLGFCNEGDEEILVYEFVPNSSLDHFIFDEDKRSLLTWEVRFRIIEGIARGLLYLHEDSQLKIIHRDLKASNILLDAEMNPKVADFGTARLFDSDETRAETKRIAGTRGYMAPEYLNHGQISAKSDVYSFGVMLLEMISGERNNSFEGEGLAAFVSFFTIFFFFLNSWRFWAEARNPPRTETTACNISFVPSVTRTGDLKLLHISVFVFLSSKLYPESKNLCFWCRHGKDGLKESLRL
jgi:serine/threonine protein kinase